MYPLSILFNLLIFVVVSLILTSLGKKILHLFSLNTSKLVEFIYSFVLGYGFFGYFLYLMGILKIFYFWLIWLALILILIISFKEFIFWVKIIWHKIKGISYSKLVKNKLYFILLLLVTIWLIIVFLGAVSPLIDFDSRWYHFGEAKYYLENHRISIETFWAGTGSPSIFWPSAFPRLSEIFFAVFLSFKAEIAAKLINFAFGIIGALAIFSYARSKMSNHSSLVAGLVVLVSIPFISNAIAGYIDLIVFGLAAVAFLPVFFWLEDKEKNINYIILAGIISGLGCSVKLNAIFLVPIITFIIVAQLLFIDRNIKKTLLFPLTYLFSVFIFSFAWYLNDRLSTGSFTYPMGSVQHETAIRENVFQGSFKLFFNIILLIFPLVGLVIFGFRKKFARIIFFLLFSSIVYYIFWDWGSNTINEPRYLLSAFFGLSVIVGLGCEYLLKLSRISRISVSVFIVLIILAQIVMAVRAEKKYYPYIVGLKTRQQFLTENMAPDWWTVYDYSGEIKKVTQGKKVLVAGNAWHTYYIDFPYAHASLSKINFKLINSTQLLAQELKSEGFDFVLMKKDDIKELISHTSISNSETGGYFEQIYCDPYSEIIIYRINP